MDAENEIRLSAVFPVDPQILYTAWLSSRGHSAFTGSTAKVDQNIGGKFSAWDDYITGETLEAEPYGRIVQKWRNTDFPEGHPDSRLEILFEDDQGHTKMTLIHTGFPEDMADELKSGWREYYLRPMRKYFTRRTREKWEDAFL